MKQIKTLIAEAGATKTAWATIFFDNSAGPVIFGPGLNAATSPEKDFTEAFQSIRMQLPELVDDPVIYFYGAGCATPGPRLKVAEAAKTLWPDCTVTVATDLLAAAKALFGDRKGIACIMGTGSNSGLYDGKEIAANIPSMGYILGDEGSGAVLGRRLLNEVYKGEMPDQLKERIIRENDLSYDRIVEKTYQTPGANKFLASLVPVIRKHLDSPFLYNMVVDEFRAFLKRNVLHYPDARSLPLGFVGSVAYFFEEPLREAARAEGLEISAIIRAPLQELILYHIAHPNPNFK